jgi:hypothetical protein
VLVLVSFVLVLAAAVTLVVGLLQSGLTLIYLSIGCSVLAGVVLAVAVLRGRPEPRAAAPVGRAYTPPASAPPAPATTSTYEPATTSTYQPAAASTYQPPPAPTTSYTPPPPPPPPTSAPPAPSDDAAVKAAGTALLGRLRRNRGEEPSADDAAEPTFPEPAEPVTMQMPAASAEADDGFPIADYDSLRATDLLRRLGPLDRNQLEAVRDRELAGKNRFTILSRIDTLLAAKEEPAWEVDEDEWEAGSEAEPIAVGGIDDDFDDEDFEEGVAGEIEDDEADEFDDEEPEEAFVVGPASATDFDDDEDEEFDELVSPVDDFPIAGYDSLTVGQILPRLSDLDADELAQVRQREQAGRARGTILDRVDRLAAKSGAARTAPAAAPPARKAPAPRKARAAKAIPVPPPPPPPAPAKKRAAKKAAPIAMPAAPAPAPRKARATKATAAIPVPPAKKATARKATGARKVTPPTETETTTPMKAAVKKARAAKKRS